MQGAKGTLKQSQVGNKFGGPYPSIAGLSNRQAAVANEPQKVAVWSDCGSRQLPLGGLLTFFKKAKAPKSSTKQSIIVVRLLFYFE